jgi:lipid-A-disaccharide synthase
MPSAECRVPNADPAPSSVVRPPSSLLVVAGELSGDMHAAHVVRELKQRRPDLHVFGIGGDHLRAEGMEILVDAREMAVLGFWEVLKRYGFFKRVFEDLRRTAAERRPDAVLLVDYPGFNLRFAAAAKALGLKVLYYVCPQVWAWNRARIPRMAAVVDRLMAIFPFEPAVFAGTSLRVDFVGHPLVETAQAARTEPPAELPWRGAPRIALLPGSRRMELERLLPIFWGAAREIEKASPGCSFLLAAASDRMAALARELIAGLGPGPQRVEIVEGSTRQILRQADAALVASGTATLETALMGCPMLVVYKTAWPTYVLGRMLVRVPFLGMVNLIAERELCPEFIQHAATPSALARALQPLLTDTPARRAMVQGLAEVSAKLGHGGAAENVARIVDEELPTRSP